MKIFGHYILSKEKVEEWYDLGWDSASNLIYSAVSDCINSTKKKKKSDKKKIEEIQEFLDMTYNLMKGLKNGK